MKNKDLVKLDLLNKKIYEYFSKNPKSKGAIFKLEIGEDKSHWKVCRDKGNLKIVEVNIKNKNFIMEAPIGQVRAHEKDAIEKQLQKNNPVVPIQPPSPMAAPSPMAPPPLPPPAAGMAPAPAPPMNVVPPPAQPMIPPLPPPSVGMAPPPLPPPAPAPGGPMSPISTAPIAPSDDTMEPPTSGGKVNWDKIVDLIDKAKNSDPEGFKQRFGASPEMQLQNPAVPPELALNTNPPDERGGHKIDTSSVNHLQEASPEYSNIKNLFVQAVEQPNVANLNRAMQAIGQAFPVLQGQDKQSAESMLQALALFQGQSTGLTSPTGTTTTRTSTMQYAHKSKQGKILREDDYTVSDPIGLETDPVQAIERPQFQPTTSEEAAVLMALKGQTIKDVKIENDDQSVSVTFVLATSEWPAILKWYKTGKLAFIVKNQRYVLQKKWN